LEEQTDIFFLMLSALAAEPKPS